MKSIIKFTYCMVLAFLVVLFVQDANAGNYDHNDYRQYKRSRSENPYYPESKGYPNFPGPGRAQIYYACPYGDYISDRSGRCPVHGRALIQKRAVQQRQGY